MTIIYNSSVFNEYFQQDFCIGGFSKTINYFGKLITVIILSFTNVININLQLILKNNG